MSSAQWGPPASEETASQRQGYPRVSFLTTAFQTEAYLPGTIASVLAQTSLDWELVVVDNGNSDAIAGIVESVGDGRVHLIRQENRGYIGGVMAAAAVARGEVLCVLDSDDQLMPGYTERMLSYLDLHPEVDAVGCDAHLFLDGEDKPHGRGYLRSVGSRRPAPGGDVLTLADVLGGRVPYYTAAIRRSPWRAVGGYDPEVAGVDESVLIWLLLTRDFDVRLLPDKLARYRVREESLSRDPTKVEGFERDLIRTFETFALSSGNPQHALAVRAPLRRLRYHQELRRARWAFREGDVPAARRAARRAFAQQHTVRAGTVVLLLILSPRLLRAVYPLKQGVGQVARHAGQCFRAAVGTDGQRG